MEADSVGIHPKEVKQRAADSSARRCSVVRSDSGVWMMQNRNMISFSREIAERILRETGGDPNDWKARDRIISSICDFVDETLDEVSQNPTGQDRPEKGGKV